MQLYKQVKDFLILDSFVYICTSEIFNHIDN